MEENEEKHHEICYLVWLDTAQTQSAKKIAAQQEVRSIINCVTNFQEENQCEDFLRTASRTDRLVLIISGQVGQKFIPQIYHQSDQIISIYVICADRSKHLQWTSQYPKVSSRQRQRPC